MKKLILLTSVFLYCLSCSGQMIRNDTIPAKLLVSNTYKKQSSGVWVINGFVVRNSWRETTAYLGRKRKPIPSYIHVWNYTTK